MNIYLEKISGLSSLAQEVVKGLKLEGIRSGYKGVKQHTESAENALKGIQDYIEENREAKRLQGAGPEHIIKQYFKNSSIGKTFKDPKLQSHAENYVNGVTHAEESKETLKKGLKRSGKTYGALAGVGAGTGVGYKLIKGKHQEKQAGLLDLARKLSSGVVDFAKSEGFKQKVGKGLEGLDSAGRQMKSIGDNALGKDSPLPTSVKSLRSRDRTALGAGAAMGVGAGALAFGGNKKSDN